MKQQYQKIYAFVIFFILTTGASQAEFFQNPNGPVIPFQGALYENGAPVNGPVDITFSITDPSWTETHQSVQVIQGLYSVTLGSGNAFPDELFTTGTPALKVIVGGTEIATVDLQAPYINEGIIAQNMPTRIVKDSPKIPGDTAVHFLFSGDDYRRGIQVDMSGAGLKYAIRSNVTSEAGDSGWKVGAITSASGEGEGRHSGLYGQAFGKGLNNNGVTGVAGGEGNGVTGYGDGSYNNGVLGIGHSNLWGNSGVTGFAQGTVGVDNVGVAGVATVGDVGNTTILNNGVIGRAEGLGINRGVYGSASNGVENWAGYFEGDVNVNGQLMVNGSPISGGSGPAPGEAVQVTNPGGDLRAELSYFDPNNAGSLVLYGANDSTKAILGSSNGGFSGGLWLYDSLRNLGAQLRVTSQGRGNLYTNNENHKNVGWFGGIGNDGFAQLVSYDDSEVFSGAALIGSFADGKLPEFYLEGSKQPDFGLVRLRTEEINGEEAGSLELNRSNGGGSFRVSIVNDPNNNDPTGFGAEMFLHGTNTPNFQIGGQPWENSDLGFFSMYGRTGDGGGWYHSNLNMSVNSDGSNDWSDFSMTKSNIATNSNDEMIHLSANDGNITAAGNIHNPRVDVLKDWGTNGHGAVIVKDANDTGMVNAVVAEDGSNYQGVVTVFNNQNAFLTEMGGDGYFSIHNQGVGDVFNVNNSGNLWVQGDISADGGISSMGIMSTDVLHANNYYIPNGTFSLNSGNAGNGDFANMELNSDPSNRINMGFADTNEDAGFISVTMADTELALLNAVTGGPGGAIFGALNLADDLGNSVSINGFGDISATGDISANTLTSSDGMVQTSDQRFKKNVKSIDNALAKTQQLNGYTYNWNKLAKKQKGITNEEEQVGVLAQELEEVFPQLVKTDEYGYKAVNYAALTAVLIEAVKELSAEVTNLKAENTELKAEFSKVASLEAKINLIEKLLTEKNKADELKTASK